MKKGGRIGRIVVMAALVSLVRCATEVLRTTRVMEVIGCISGAVGRQRSVHGAKKKRHRTMIRKGRGTVIEGSDSCHHKRLHIGVKRVCALNVEVVSTQDICG